MPTRNFDPLTPSLLSLRLGNTIFGDERNIRHFTEIGSTNTTAMQAAVQGAAEGSVFIAEAQLGGRGRGGHNWHSEAGSGIYVSVILRPRLEPSAALGLSLITGIAVHDAVKLTCDTAADLRWPNDVLLSGKKVAGILTETSADMRQRHHAVVGIGINVNQSAFPPDLAVHATSLRIETGREWPRIAIVVALLESLDRQYRALQSDPVAAQEQIIAAFEERSSFARGAMVTVHDREESATQYVGKTLGLDERGFLRVQTAEGVRTVLSGGIRKVSAAEGI
jgi:BirA family transcriptional regulator, biotin operon repressor / biotin---[acetyl-CoA-carboxylase] ligase